MKKIILYTFCILSMSSMAQRGINYSAILKDNAGNLLVNQNVSLEFSIFQGLSQNLVYTETHSATTNENGYVSVVIGNGTITFIDGNGVSYESDRHFIETKLDSGSGLVSLGITEIQTVPYAIHSESAKRITGTVNNLSDADQDTTIKVENIADSDKVEIQSNGTTELVLDQTGLIIGSSEKAYNASLLNSKRMFYDKEKSAFRGGFNNNENWDDANVGLYSFAYGFNAEATGQQSIAFGANTLASDGRSFAIGYETQSLGRDAFVGGWQSIASGDETFVYGDNNIAYGVGSFATGRNTYTIHPYSSVFGSGTKSTGQNSMTVGQYNLDSSNSLFVVGNGTSDTNRSSAFQIKNDGTILLPNLANGETQDLQVDANGAVIVKPIQTKILILSGLNLVPSNPALDFINSSNGVAILQAGNWFMPINLPEGAIIKRLSFIYKDISVVNVTFSLIRTSLTTGGTTTLYTYDSVNAGNTFQTIHSDELTIPISNFSNFVLSMTAGNSSDELRAIRVEYLEP